MTRKSFREYSPMADEAYDAVENATSGYVILSSSKGSYTYGRQIDYASDLSSARSVTNKTTNRGEEALVVDALTEEVVYDTTEDPRQD